MSLDKELYRQAYELHRQWNIAEMKERVHEAGHRSPEEGWQQFVDLWEAGRQMGVAQSQRQLEQRLADWAAYYRNIQKFEEWRRTLGRTA